MGTAGITSPIGSPPARQRQPQRHQMMILETITSSVIVIVIFLMNEGQHEGGRGNQRGIEKQAKPWSFCLIYISHWIFLATLVALHFTPVSRGGRYIDEKLSKADKSVFLKLSATYRYRKMKFLKLSKNYRYRKMTQILDDR